MDAIVDFLEARPSDEVLAEAVRSLAARQLLVAGSTGEQVRVRGDLGIALAFQQRARMVLDARATGTVPGEPWRILVLPQLEHICLVVRIDALGVHEIGLYVSDRALDDLVEWLPKGESANPGAIVDANSTRYTTKGSTEIAGASSDLILARHDGRLHVFGRDTGHTQRLVSRPLGGKDVRGTLAGLLA